MELHVDIAMVGDKCSAKVWSGPGYNKLDVCPSGSVADTVERISELLGEPPQEVELRGAASVSGEVFGEITGQLRARGVNVS